MDYALGIGHRGGRAYIIVLLYINRTKLATMENTITISTTTNNIIIFTKNVDSFIFIQFKIKEY